MHHPMTQSEARRRITGAFAQKHPYSLSRALQAMVNGGLAGGTVEFDEAQRLAEEDGQLFDANRIKLPWSVLGVTKRDLTSQTGGGGYLIGTETTATALEPTGLSLAFDSGATVLSLPKGVGDVIVPRVAGRPDTTWLSSEGAVITESQPTLGAVVATMKSVATLVDGTRLLRVQSPGIFDQVLQPTMSRAVWSAMDTAIVSGSGDSGQPLGLASTGGVGIVSGTSLSWANLTLKSGAVAGGVNGLSWWAGANAEKALRGREKFSGAGPIWGDAGIAGAPAYATSTVTTDSLVVGDFSRIVVFVWGSPTLEIDPYADFARGLWSARLVLDADFVCLTPAAFSIATGVT